VEKNEEDFLQGKDHMSETAKIIVGNKCDLKNQKKVINKDAE